MFKMKILCPSRVKNIDIFSIDIIGTEYRCRLKGIGIIKVNGGAWMEKNSISKATLGRIPRYLEFLRGLSPEKVPYISATTISKKLSLGEVQVRKDLAMVSGAGKPRLGYEVEFLIEQLEDCLGHNKLTFAVLVGAGKLGRALLQYDGFEHFGVKIVAAFDSYDKAMGIDSTTEILPMKQFEDYCKEHNIQIGIITVGVGSAQAVCDQMVKSGITAIWNFAPCKLQVPEGVLLQNENLALSLAHLRNQMPQSQAASDSKPKKQINLQEENNESCSVYR